MTDDFRFSPRANRAHEIAWRPWGTAAFAESEQTGKPVLLSISAVWCHWCHAMDETTYSDTRIITAINEGFVPMRVDNDRRPDVNRRYNMGGWPTTAFLTAHGEIIDGATYLAPEQMAEALLRVEAFYIARGKELLQRAPAEPAESAHAVGAYAVGGDAAHAGEPAPADEPEIDIAAEVVETIAAVFDPVHGGFGSAPKFPQTDALSLLLAWHAAHDERHTGEIVAETLREMGGGAIHDHVGGGFFRYATERDWSTPHYEKMLEDNAKLAMLYLDAAVFLDDEDDAAVAGDILDYLTETLWLDRPPAFAGSQDADERYYAIDSAGGRSALPAPAIDRTVYVDWNALAASALLRGSYVLDRQELVDTALATLDHLWDTCRAPDGMRHYAGGPADGLLGDQAHMAAALLDAYEVTAERAYLARAETLADLVDTHLSLHDGRLADRCRSSDDAGLLAVVAPALEENAAMADVLLRLTAYSGKDRFGQRALRILGAWAADASQQGLPAARYALALLRLHAHPAHIVVIGESEDDQARALLRAALRAAAPQRTVQLLDLDADAEHIVRAGYDIDAAPAAYVCAGVTCQEPTNDPEAIAVLLEQLLGDRP
jgi:uncharacterized protein YyaL (SSP411 family)